MSVWNIGKNTRKRMRVPEKIKRVRNVFENLRKKSRMWEKLWVPGKKIKHTRKGNRIVRKKNKNCQKTVSVTWKLHFLCIWPQFRHKLTVFAIVIIEREISPFCNRSDPLLWVISINVWRWEFGCDPLWHSKYLQQLDISLFKLSFFG